MDGDVPRRASYGVYISQLIRFARVCNHVTDFNARNKCLTAKLLQQGYRYHKLRKTFYKCYRRHYELISKYNVGLKTLLSEGLSEPEMYGDLVYKFKKLIVSNDFSFQFRKIITRYRRIGYIYSTKKLRKMCLRACNKRTVIFHEIRTSYYHKLSFYLLNEGLFGTIALTEAWKISVKVDWSSHHFSQNCQIVHLCISHHKSFFTQYSHLYRHIFS